MFIIGDGPLYGFTLAPEKPGLFSNICAATVHNKAAVDSLGNILWE